MIPEYDQSRKKDRCSFTDTLYSLSRLFSKEAKYEETISRYEPARYSCNFFC